MPVNSVNTVGYVYLDSNAFISLKDMQGNKINTYVFNHTIDYDGTILDEIACPALTETETKYTYTPEVLQKLQKTEFIVNKQEQRITEIVENQSEYEDKLTQINIDLDGVKQEVSNSATYKRDINGVTQIYVNDASPTEILSLEIQGNKTYEANLFPSEDLYPSSELYPNMEVL